MKKIKNSNAENSPKLQISVACRGRTCPNTKTFPTDPPVLKILREGKSTMHSKVTIAQCFAIATPWRENNFLDFKGIATVKEGLAT